MITIRTTRDETVILVDVFDMPITIWELQLLSRAWVSRENHHTDGPDVPRMILGLLADIKPHSRNTTICLSREEAILICELLRWYTDAMEDGTIKLDDIELRECLALSVELLSALLPVELQEEHSNFTPEEALEGGTNLEALQGAEEEIEEDQRPTPIPLEDLLKQVDEAAEDDTLNDII